MQAPAGTTYRLGTWRAALCFAACVAATIQASAQSFVHEFKLGALYHDMPVLWSGSQRERTAVDINAELILAPSIAFLGGTIRPAIGGTVNTRGETSKGYIDARWQIEGPANLFFGLGLGAAVHDGNTDIRDRGRKALGSLLLFHIPFEAGLRLDARNAISIYYDHMSNGYTRRYNEGLDTLGVRYGYRF